MYKMIVGIENNEFLGFYELLSCLFVLFVVNLDLNQQK
jgi:hypothetical protein